MDGWMDQCIDGWIDQMIYKMMDRWIDRWIDRCIDQWFDGSMVHRLALLYSCCIDLCRKPHQKIDHPPRLLQACHLTHTLSLTLSAFYRASNQYAERMEEGAAMACSQRARRLIYHATGTSYELDAARMEESAAMACSEQARRVINLLMGFAANINAAGIE